MKHIEVASIFLVEIQLFKTCSLEYRNSGTVTFPLVNQLAYKIFVKPVNLSDNLIYLYTYIYTHILFTNVLQGAQNNKAVSYLQVSLCGLQIRVPQRQQ